MLKKVICTIICSSILIFVECKHVPSNFTKNNDKELVIIIKNTGEFFVKTNKINRCAMAIKFNNKGLPYIIRKINSKKILVWNVKTNKQSIITRKQDSVISNMFFDSEDKLVIVSKRKKSNLLYINNGNKIITIEDNRKFFTISPNRKLICFHNIFYPKRDKSFPAIWDIKKQKIIQKLKDKKIFLVSFNADGSKVATGTWHNKFGNMTTIWDVKNGNKLKNFSQGGLTTSIAFSNDGKLMATGAGFISGGYMWFQITIGDYSIRIWDVKAGKMLKKLKGHNGNVSLIVFSPDDKILASVGGDLFRTIRIWNIEKGNLLHILKRHDSMIKSILYNPDGKLLFSSCRNNTLRVWDIKTGELLAILANFGEKGWIIVATNGKYEGSKEGLKQLYWQIGDKKIPVIEYKKELYTKGLLREILGYK